MERVNLNSKVVEAAGACLQCGSPAPCVRACPQHAPIPDAMRLLARAAIAAQPRAVWVREAEGRAVSEVAQALWVAYW
jgi:NADPH-dependent glutamate synthase beta subunit-like oxidoreductase